MLLFETANTTVEATPGLKQNFHELSRGILGKKILLLIAASLFAACLMLTLILFLVQPASPEFRLATVSTLVALVPLVFIALQSLRAFRRERRIASARLINEVRLHRAETKLLQADIEDLTRTLTAEGNNTGLSHEEIKRELEKTTAKLSEMSTQGENAVVQLVNYSAVRTKQLVALLEAQRVTLERVSEEQPEPLD